VVFVVDADESRRRSSERMLQRAGYNVRSFASPEALMKAVSQRRSSPPRSRPAGVDVEAERSLDQLEREAIEAALRRTHGNITRAMKQLGIGRTTLYRKLKRYGLR
jgi:DNA-binding NtrC family response regulator